MVKENEVSFNLKIQLQIANSLLEYLKNQQNFDILPANIGVEDAGINELLLSFNTLVMDRNNLLVSATKESPIVSQINEKLKNLKNASLKGINRYIKNLQVSLSNYQKTNNESLEYISTFPQKEYILRTLAREFKFAEDLLVFLSQRKEEASISFVSVLPNLKVLSYGIANNKPIAPINRTIYIGALIIGLLIPFSILIFIKNPRH